MKRLLEHGRKHAERSRVEGKKRQENGNTGSDPLGDTFFLLLHVLFHPVPGTHGN